MRVLDLSRLLPGAFATLMLAELGADIIKVEDPAGGDPIRQLPPFINPQGAFAAPGRSVYDLLLNRGKRSMALDLRDPGSQPTLEALLSSVDVVVESFRPATAQRLGVAGSQLRARHPRLIHLALTGYGQTGPYAERPGHDLNYVAVSGVLAADRPEPAHLPRMFIADVGGGAMCAVVAVLAALFGRERCGVGATLDVSMHDAALYWVMLPGARDLIDGGARAVGELPTFGDHACYNVYETRDGRQVALGALEPKFWTTFCDAIARPDLGVGSSRILPIRRPCCARCARSFEPGRRRSGWHSSTGAMCVSRRSTHRPRRSRTLTLPYAAPWSTLRAFAPSALPSACRSGR